MSIPESFADLPLAGKVRATEPVQGETWESPEGIGILPIYGPEHLEGLDALDTYPGLAPFLRGPYPTMYTTLTTHLAAQLSAHFNAQVVAVASVIAAKGYNPFDGVKPDFGPFTGLLTSKIGMLLGLAWALAFAYCAFHLIIGLATLARGRRQGIADAVEDGKGTLLWAGGAVLGLGVLPVIYGVLVQ